MVGNVIVVTQRVNNAKQQKNKQITTQGNPTNEE